MKIQPLQKEHYPQVAAIYAEGLATGIASFETQIPDWQQWDEKFLDICRFVYMKEDQMAAWCALSAVSKRAVYRGVAEDTIYVASRFQKQGIGKKLLQHLIDESEKAGFWTLQAGIFPENESSIRLHEKCGFRRIGIRKKIAQRRGKWHDNVLLERRVAVNSNNKS